MSTVLKRMLALLFSLMALSAGKTLMFIQESHKTAPWPDDVVLIFHTPDAAAITVNSTKDNTAKSDFSTTHYAVRSYECTLIAKHDNETRHYWWFFDAIQARIVILPAPTLFTHPLKPTLVYPEAVQWRIESSPRLFTALAGAAGGHLALQQIAQKCRLFPAMYVY